MPAQPEDIAVRAVDVYGAVTMRMLGLGRTTILGLLDAGELPGPAPAGRGRYVVAGQRCRVSGC